jgi:hypothetical protein
MLCVTFSFVTVEAAEQSECVGRLQFTLPLAAEVAGASFNEMKQQIAQPYNTPRYSFSDGEEPWSSRIFFTGPMLISNQMEDEKIADLIRAFGMGHKVDVMRNSYTWNAGRATRTLLRIGDHVLLVNVATGDTLAANKMASSALASQVALRRISSVPAQSGLCLPYVFIQTDKFDGRYVSATYKLLAHPDVTVWISEASSVAQVDAVRLKNAMPKNVINSFWSQYETGRNVEKVEPMLLQKNGRPVKLAGQEGLASFVKISRKGGGEDYGYYASSPGEPGNESSPEINIYVIRNSAFAKSRPMDKEEFVKLAEAVQASLALRRQYGQ